MRPSALRAVKILSRTSQRQGAARRSTVSVAVGVTVVSASPVSSMLTSTPGGAVSTSRTWPLSLASALRLNAPVL